VRLDSTCVDWVAFWYSGVFLRPVVAGSCFRPVVASVLLGLAFEAFLFWLAF
jgi:hypothetical protein